MEASWVSGAGSLALVLAIAAPAGAATTGAEQFDGGLISSGKSGQRKVAGSVVAATGVFTGVGRIVERPNRPGDTSKVSRDDLVFREGTLHIVNTSGKASQKVDRRRCRVTFTVRQTTVVQGGTGRFAGATGSFSGVVAGTGVARRTRAGGCDQSRAALVELDGVSATGTLTF